MTFEMPKLAHSKHFPSASDKSHLKSHLLHLFTTWFTFTVRGSSVLISNEEKFLSQSCPEPPSNLAPQFRSQQYSDTNMVLVGCPERILQTWSKSRSPGKILLPNVCKQDVRHGELWSSGLSSESIVKIRMSFPLHLLPAVTSATAAAVCLIVHCSRVIYSLYKFRIGRSN